MTFWLIDQTTLNVAPLMRDDLQISDSLSDIAVSIAALFSGIFIVVAGGLADRFGRAKVIYVGLVLNALGSLLELAGTFVFALSGAAAGVRHRLDLFGVLVLSCATATAGGMTRDLLIGAVPPVALRDWRYLGTAVLAGLLVFFSSPRAERQHKLRTLVLTFDAAGLALFAVSGTQTALGYGLSPVMAALLGMLTGIGGGMLRDVLVSDIPAVLHSELYAVAALAGALVVVAGHALNAPPTEFAVAGATVCFGIRLVALWRGWRLPTAGQKESAVGSADHQGERRDPP